MDIQIRTIDEDEFPKWVRAQARGFGGHATDEEIRVARSFAELDRTFAAFDGDQIVGTTTTRTSGITVPGGVAQLGFVDDVTVLPTRRRRGILTRMMRRQLEQIHERGEPLAALTASESLIYERFGFGIATWIEGWNIQRQHTSFRLPPSGGGSIDFIDADTARREWPGLHARVAANRVGMVRYDAGYWRAALWYAEFQRRGMTELFHVAYRRGDRMAGLVTYRIKDHTVFVVFLLGEDAEVEVELWRYCFGIDLMSETQAYVQPPDDPLPWRLEDPRRLNRQIRDHFWLRMIDVSAALRARSYDDTGRLAIRVNDPTCAWNQGAYALEADADGADCAPTTQIADIEMTVSDLASVYLGGVSFATLHRAGRIETCDTAAIKRADRMFRTERVPWSLEL